ncbi:MAG: GLPGLI family protein [Aestuariibaculum sp.]
MKKLTTFITLSFISILSAQDFQGIAHYTSKTQIREIKISGLDITPAMQQQLNERLQKGAKKSYILNFTKTESVFQEEEKLEMGSPSSGMQVMRFGGGKPSKLYKNIKEKTYIEEENFFSKEFLVIDSIEVKKWELLNESKTIGNYTCYKAKLTIPVTKKQLQKYKKAKEKKDSGENMFMMIPEPKEKTIEAWYTMDIPVSNGPSEYGGIPGLILELHTDRTVYLCTKVILNPKEKINIKKPNKGKKVTRTAYQDIIEKKLQEMKQKNRNNKENSVIEIRTN